MKKNYKKHLLALVEGAMMVALAWAIDALCALIPSPFLYGGSITVGMLPIVYFSYRHGAGWGMGAGLVFSGLQMIMGWYPPPAGTWWAFGKRRLLGYGVGAVTVCLCRFVCSFLSGGILWTDYAPEGMNAWVYSLAYNAGYMIPNAILTAVVAVLLCKVFDPKTLRPMKK